MAIGCRQATRRARHSLVRGHNDFVSLSGLPRAIVYLGTKLLVILKASSCHGYCKPCKEPSKKPSGCTTRVKALDLSKVVIPAILPKPNLYCIQPFPDESLALLDVHPDDPRHEENDTRKPMFDRGLQLMSEGKVVVVCLAGDVWVHSDRVFPVGMLDIGLPSHKSLFQLQAERLRRVQAMAERTQPANRKHKVRIMLIVVTSPATDSQTRMHFAEMSYFNLVPSQVRFVLQEDFPCISESGGFIFDSKRRIVKAPCGDGGLYTALMRGGILAELEYAGVQYVDVFSADNALARVADPHLIGHADLSGADVCAKVVAKAYPGQPGSIFVLRNGQPELIDSTILSFRETMKYLPGTGKLKYNWANKGSFCFTPAFLRRAYLDLETSRRFHSHEGIIFTDEGPVKGTRMLARIHDPLHLARNLVLMEVDGSAHFAPVSGPLSPMPLSRVPDPVYPCRGTVKDLSNEARSAVLALHRRWIKKFGGVIDHADEWEGPEISPLKSYLGESLGYVVYSRIFGYAFDPILQGLVTDHEECKELLKKHRAELNLSKEALLTQRLRRWEPEAETKGSKAAASS